MLLMDIPRIDVAIAEFARLLEDGGILVFSITHPCFFCYDWIPNEHGERAHKEISDYLIPKIYGTEFLGENAPFSSPPLSLLRRFVSKRFLR
jgi:hypothetical protein